MGGAKILGNADEHHNASKENVQIWFKFLDWYILTRLKTVYLWNVTKRHIVCSLARPELYKGSPVLYVPPNPRTREKQGLRRFGSRRGPCARRRGVTSPVWYRTRSALLTLARLDRQVLTTFEKLFDPQLYQGKKEFWYLPLLKIIKIINCFIECPEILKSIYFIVPSRTRSRDTFGRDVIPNTYSYNGYLLRMTMSANWFSTTTDIFF